MVTLNIASNTRTYSLPNAALTPMTLPKIGRALSEAHGYLFDKQYPGMVNQATDSQLCIRAFEAGLIGSSELGILQAHPNNFGLYQLRERTADAIGKAVTIQAKGNFADEEALLVRLNDRGYDLQSASSSVLRCIDAGLMQVSDVESLLKYGQRSAAALIDKVVGAITEEVGRDHPIAEQLMIDHEGEWLALDMGGLARMTLQLPDVIDDEFAPVNVLLFKTLHALQQIFFYFQTSSSFLGEDSYYADAVSLTYEELKGQIANLDFEELKAYLHEMGESRNEHELFCVIADDPEVMDDDLIAYAAKLLSEMHLIQSRTGYKVDASNPEELRQVLREAQDHLKRPSRYTTVLEAIVDALKVCIERGTADHWDENAYYEAFGDDCRGEQPMSLFDGILVEASWHTPNLMEYSCNTLDSYANDMMGPSLRLPLASDAMSEITLPLIKQMGECFRLLSRLTDALKETPNAGH